MLSIAIPVSGQVMLFVTGRVLLPVLSDNVNAVERLVAMIMLQEWPLKQPVLFLDFLVT